MKCRYCGKEWSDSVVMAHENRCIARAQVIPEVKESNPTTRAEIKEALRIKNVKFNPRAKKEVLEALLNIEEKFVFPDEVE